MDPIKQHEKVLSGREYMFALPSIIIGVSVLTLPTDIAKVTEFSDGWVAILVAGIISTILAVLALKLALHYQNQSFLDYTSYLVSRPVAIIISLSFVLSAILVSAFVTRSVAFIAQQFLFERTPMPVLALAFLLVVIYAVAGTRVGIFRLNMLFLPFILFVFLLVGLFNIPWIEGANYLPVFKTDLQGYMKGILQSTSVYTGFGIALFYIFLVKPQKDLTKQTLLGMGISVIFYLFIFLITIGVFGNIVTKNLMFPTLDLAKRVDIPGAIFERIDAIVYTIWIMAIFNTVCLFLDICVLLLTSIFKKAKKQIIVMILSPFIFFVGLFPREIYQVNELMGLTTKITLYPTIAVIIIFYILTKLKGVNMNDKV